MRNRLRSDAFLFLLLLPATSGVAFAQGTPPKEPDKTTVIVLDPTGGEIDADTRLAVSSKIGVDLGRSTEFSVVTAADIRGMLELEANRQLAGCTTESCLSEVAAALGADVVVTWSVGSVGGEKIFSITLFDAVKQAAAGRGLAPINDGDVLNAASAALRKALSAYRRSNGTLSPIDAYESAELSVRDGFGGRQYARGADGVRIEPAEFFATIERPDLAKAHEDDEAFKETVFWGIVGVTAAVGAAPSLAALAVAAGFGAAGLFVDRRFAGFGIIVAVVAINLLVPGAVVIGGGALAATLISIFLPPSTPFRDEVALANQFNRRLAQDLGLSDADLE